MPLPSRTPEPRLAAISRTLNGGTSVLVTGGAGFIGSHLCRVLLTRGHEVYAVDNEITGRRENIVPLLDHERFHFVPMDIVSASFPRYFKDRSFHQVYHLACPTGVPNIRLLAEEMLRTCSIGTLHVLELARRHRAAAVLASSCEVYGQPEVFPQSESYHGNVDPIGPRSPYEEGKRFAESVFAMYARKYGVDAKIIRFFNVYGPGMSPQDQRVIPRFLWGIAGKNHLTVYGNGEQTRTFLYIDDLIHGLLLIMRKGRAAEAYNIGGRTQITIKALARLMLKLTKFEDGITFTPHFIEDHRGRQPSLEKIAVLGWRQTVSLEEGLKRMIAAWGLGNGRGKVGALPVSLPDHKAA